MLHCLSINAIFAISRARIAAKYSRKGNLKGRGGSTTCYLESPEMHTHLCSPPINPTTITIADVHHVLSVPPWIQYFLAWKIHKNHLEHFLKQMPEPTPRDSDSVGRGGVQILAFPEVCQVIQMLLVCGPHFEWRSSKWFFSDSFYTSALFLGVHVNLVN